MCHSSRASPRVDSPPTPSSFDARPFICPSLGHALFHNHQACPTSGCLDRIGPGGPPPKTHPPTTSQVALGHATNDVSPMEPRASYHDTSHYQSCHATATPNFAHATASTIQQSPPSDVYDNHLCTYRTRHSQLWSNLLSQCHLAITGFLGFGHGLCRMDCHGTATESATSSTTFQNTILSSQKDAHHNYYRQSIAPASLTLPQQQPWTGHGQDGSTRIAVAHRAKEYPVPDAAIRPVWIFVTGPFHGRTAGCSRAAAGLVGNDDCRRQTTRSSHTSSSTTTTTTTTTRQGPLECQRRGQSTLPFVLGCDTVANVGNVAIVHAAVAGRKKGRRDHSSRK
jgi:hypothetical protein